MRRVQGVFAAVFLVGIAFLLFQKAMLQGLNHDEHQFVAPPALLAQEGMLPYRDYAFMHMPNLVFVYALFDAITPYHLLAARLFNAVCAWALVALIFARALRLLQRDRDWERLASAM